MANRKFVVEITKEVGRKRWQRKLITDQQSSLKISHDLIKIEGSA